MSDSDNIFLAGAGGAIGRRLCRLLVADGWRVFGTTRSPQKAAMLRSMGVEPLIVDVFDAEALAKAARTAHARIVIHQLTDLPPGLEPKRMAAARQGNARLRDAGTRNLIAAGLACGMRRLIAQSISFAYAPGPLPYREDAPLNVDAPDESGGINARGVASLENQVLRGAFEGLVLRYGRLYGPGTGFDTPPAGGPVHVDAAAEAARLAVSRGSTGIYNVAEEDGTVCSAKAASVLGWRHDFRIREG
ncbi:MAG TPA: NAD(P)H-binding protein [Steroidobacteraceae bacterium]|nr:NAD(P)H-binding protein [Steroidobacteraceae bacterium]